MSIAHTEGQWQVQTRPQCTFRRNWRCNMCGILLKIWPTQSLFWWFKTTFQCKLSRKLHARNFIRFFISVKHNWKHVCSGAGANISTSLWYCCVLTAVIFVVLLRGWFAAFIYIFIWCHNVHKQCCSTFSNLQRTKMDFAKSILWLLKFAWNKK